MAEQVVAHPLMVNPSCPLHPSMQRCVVAAHFRPTASVPHSPPSLACWPSAASPPWFWLGSCSDRAASQYSMSSPSTSTPNGVCCDSLGDQVNDSRAVAAARRTDGVYACNDGGGGGGAADGSGGSAISSGVTIDERRELVVENSGLVEKTIEPFFDTQAEAEADIKGEANTADERLDASSGDSGVD